MKDIVDKFIEKYNTVYDSIVKDPMAKTEGFKEYYLSEILKNTAATTGLELIRRIVGLAKVKDITSIEDPAKRARAERMCLTLAKDCIMNRAEFLCGDEYLKAILKVVKG